MESNIRNRITLLFFLMIGIMVIVVGRLAWINIYEGEVLRAEVEKEKDFQKIILPERGNILDRNGEVLAFSETEYMITINRKDIDVKSLKYIVEEMAKIIPLSIDEINTILLEADATDEYVEIIRIRDRQMAQNLSNTYIQRIWVDEELVRTYPNGTLAANVLGYVRENHGVYGLEAKYDLDLSGTEGLYMTETDGNKIELLYSDPVEIPVQNGLTITTTIDYIVQRHLEDALMTGFELHNPKAVHGVVMNVNTGEVLGMASYPTFDPTTNKLVGYDQEYLDSLTEEEFTNLHFYTWKNRVVSDAYELGSTIKLITAAVALETGMFTPESTFNEGNSIQVADRLIKCWYYPNSHGLETLTEAVANSCNPVFVKIGQAVGEEVLYKYFTDFGLHDTTGIDLPSEVKGIHLSLDRIGPTELATMTFGHGSTQSIIQVANSVAAVVNGGYLLEPHVIKSIQNDSGNVLYESSRNVTKQVISEITSQQMREIMEFVVDGGSGSAVRTNGVRVGAKTGTSEKVVNGEYSSDKAIASFLAVAPIDDPEILIYIVVDEPQDDIYGSKVAGPIANDVLQELVEYLGFTRVNEDEALYVVPNVVGLTYGEMAEVLGESEFTWSVEGDYTEESIIKTQYPLPGSEVVKGTRILLQIQD